MRCEGERGDGNRGEGEQGDGNRGEDERGDVVTVVRASEVMVRASEVTATEVREGKMCGRAK